MTDLAARALISRSGMTRRVARLVKEGLVQRADADADGRGVMVALTNAGVVRLSATAPVHARGISKLFVAPLDDQELAILERALGKVITPHLLRSLKRTPQEPCNDLKTRNGTLLCQIERITGRMALRARNGLSDPAVVN